VIARAAELKSCTALQLAEASLLFALTSNGHISSQSVTERAYTIRLVLPMTLSLRKFITNHEHTAALCTMGVTSQLWRDTAWGYRVGLGNIDTEDVYACHHVLSSWQGALVPEKFGHTRSGHLGKLFGSIPFDFVDIQGCANFPKNAKISVCELPGLAWYSMQVLDADGTVLHKDKPGLRPFTLKLTGAEVI
jgi:hypothetical protein